MSLVLCYEKESYFSSELKKDTLNKRILFLYQIVWEIIIITFISHKKPPVFYEEIKLETIKISYFV